MARRSTRPECRPLEDLVARVAKEEGLGRLDILVANPGDGHVRADQGRVAWQVDYHVESRDVVEAVLREASKGHVGVPGTDHHVGSASIEAGEGVLKADPELADHELWVPELLAVFLLGEILVAKPPAKVADVPAPVAILVDLRLSCLGEARLIERVGDQLAQRVRDRPMLEDPLHVEVEGGHRARLPVP